MRIVTQSRYGGPEVLDIREVPRPAPRENEVLVRVEAFSVTLADCAFRKADPFLVRFFAGLLRPKNLVLGDDIGGVVEAVGSGVRRLKVGDAVCARSVPISGVRPIMCAWASMRRSCGARRRWMRGRRRG